MDHYQDLMWILNMEQRGVLQCLYGHLCLVSLKCLKRESQASCQSTVKARKKNKGINRYALSVSSESVVHLVGMDRCPHTFSCLKSLYYSLNMLSKYEASLNFRIFSCIISPAIHQSKMQNFSSSIYLCQFTLQL